MNNIGVSYDAIKKCRQRDSETYIIINDPEDKRRILVEYDSLKPALKQRAHEWLEECPHEYYRKSWIKTYITPDATAKRFFDTHSVYGKALSEYDKNTYYTAIQWLNMIVKLSTSKSIIKANNCTITQYWEAVCTLINKEGIRLPGSYPRLTQKIKEFKNGNYAAVIKAGNYESSNSVIINDEIADWLVAQYALPIKQNAALLHEHYEIESIKRGWKTIKDANTIYKFLHQPEIQQLWYGPRHGFLAAAEKYSYTLRTKLPTLRDALWYSDGTKLNFFDSTGKLKASWTVYEVIDVYSEALLRYHISKTEDHVAQYQAYKMAFQTSGQKPYEIRTDNQGGHKKIESFLDQLAHHNIKTRAYNGKSKTIENIFGRLQQQIMRKFWFFTGQNITAKSLESKANMEFVLQNLKHLPTVEQIHQIYSECRTEWNNKKHPKYTSTRIECYLNSHNPKAEPVDYIDMVELFWLESKKAITYHNTGIIIEIGKTKYEYEVLKKGMPDTKFMSLYIDQKFIVKYDPDNMDHVRLYLKTDKGLQFIDIAEPRLVVPRAIQDHQPGDMNMIQSLINVSKSQTARFKQQAIDREERTGVKSKDLLNQVDTLGKYQKQLSNQDWEDEFDKPLSVVSGRSSKKESALNRI
jgi:hypothetical protein